MSRYANHGRLRGRHESCGAGYRYVLHRIRFRLGKIVRHNAREDPLSQVQLDILLDGECCGGGRECLQKYLVELSIADGSGNGGST